MCSEFFCVCNVQENADHAALINAPRNRSNHEFVLKTNKHFLGVTIKSQL